VDVNNRIAVIGAGLIGRSWAVVFAGGGCEVALHDAAREVAENARMLVVQGLEDLAEQGLLKDAPAAAARVRLAGDLRDALDGAILVQENLPEKLETKRAIFSELDRLAAPEAILASSTSTIVASLFSEELPGRHRCLVAHPVNPPHLIPLVELVGAPWTAPAIIAKAKAIYEAAGQAPIVVKREIDGFIPPRRRRLRDAAGSRQDAQRWIGLALVVHGAIRDNRAQCPRRYPRLLPALWSKSQRVEHGKSVALRG
jgi:3-hydroxyacyl-CoA dehydrogenase